MIEYLMNNELILFGILLIGALSYWIASGASRADYKAFHVVLGVSLFSTFWLGVYWTIEQCQLIDNFIIRIFISSFVVAFAAGIWRKWLADKAFRRLRLWGITTTSFGPSGAWDILESTPDGREFHYIRVHLKNGVELGSDQDGLVRKRLNKKFDFPPDIIADEQGNVVLIVTETWKKKSKKPKTNKPVDKYGRTEFTYIPASNIDRIQAYIKKG